MESCEPIFIQCKFCNNYIISEIMKCDPVGNFYHEKCFEMMRNENKDKNN